ncbi:uncharacterized protein AB675_7562 [Cyphellophora attinorum]|uniref:Uncharacterized protein n=1 Tax=Cyphellophora attinorum TaxID=1664694 RepID=A0A0N1H9R7_9EURO|nr:uncharacterized protein AB675_7562 [Phialophora attinorum]KPI40366.1 hypothetical protein AB675_7562 [Phialophora attinorum]
MASIGNVSRENASLQGEAKAGTPHIDSAFATKGYPTKDKQINRMLSALREEHKTAGRALRKLQDDIDGLGHEEDSRIRQLDELKAKQIELKEKESELQDYMRRTSSDIVGLQAVRRRLVQVENDTDTRITTRTRKSFGRLFGRLFHKQHVIESIDNSIPVPTLSSTTCTAQDIAFGSNKRIEEAIQDMYPDQEANPNPQHEHGANYSRAPTLVQRALSRCTFERSSNVPYPTTAVSADVLSSSSPSVPRVAMTRLMSRRIKRKPLPITSDLNITFDPMHLDPIAIDLPHQDSYTPLFVDGKIPLVCENHAPAQLSTLTALAVTPVSPFSPHPPYVYIRDSPVSPASPDMPVAFDAVASQQGLSSASSATVVSQTEKEALPCYLQNPRGPVFDTWSANIDLMNEKIAQPQICATVHKPNQCICTPPFPSLTPANNSPRKLWKWKRKCPTCDMALCKSCTKSRKRAQVHNTSKRVQRKLQRQWDRENLWKMVAPGDDNGPLSATEDRDNCLCHMYEGSGGRFVAPFLHGRLAAARKRAGRDDESSLGCEDPWPGMESEDGLVSWQAGDEKKATLHPSTLTSMANLDLPE